MNNAPAFWQTSIRGVFNSAGDPVPLMIKASPREERETFGISIRAFLIDDPGDPLMVIDSYYESGVVHVGNGHLLVKDEHYRGQGIGSACLAKAFSWAKHYHSDMPLSQFKIGSSKSGDEAEALKRLYESFGMRFPGPRPATGSWFCRNLKCSDIIISTSPERLDAQGMVALETHIQALRQRSVDRSKDVQRASDRADVMAQGKIFYKRGMIASLTLSAIFLLKLITA